MEIKVSLFAALRDGVGAATVYLPWKQGITCCKIIEELKERFSALASLWEYSFVAVNGCYAEPGMVLRPEDEIAVLPPVSGG